jgi:hypothetical protein
MLPIEKIGQMLLIGRMLLILPAPAVDAAPHDKYCIIFSKKKIYIVKLL